MWKNRSSTFLMDCIFRETGFGVRSPLDRDRRFWGLPVAIWSPSEAPPQHYNKSPDQTLRGPTAILFISRDTCSDSIAKRFRACFYSRRRKRWKANDEKMMDFWCRFFTVYAEFFTVYKGHQRWKKKILLLMTFFTVSFSRFTPSRFMGYRTIIARYVAKRGIAQMCLCETDR